jgi:hypothetical protein
MDDREGIGSKVALLFDRMEVRLEALAYALELAGRMDSALLIVLFLPVEESLMPDRKKAEKFQELVGRALEVIREMANGALVRAGSVCRFGDPCSELMKFLAENRSVQALVWGGDRAELSHGGKNEGQHWLSRMRDRIGVPLVVPVIKAETGRESAGMRGPVRA